MTRKSPSLDVVYDRDKPRGGQYTERRRLPRLSLSNEQFRLKSNGKIFSISDLSTDGMALRIIDRADLVLFPMGTEVEGVINLHREKYPVHARVRHVKPDLIGCQFDKLPDVSRAALDRFLDPVALGEELRPLPSSDGVLWYHGPSGTDFLLWRAVDGQFTRMALYVLGSYVHWELNAGVSTGRAEAGSEVAEERGIVRFETLLLSGDEQPDPGKLNIAKTLILSSNIPQDMKRWCVRHLGFN